VAVLTGTDLIPVFAAADVDGCLHDAMPMTQSDFHHSNPIYKYFPGWHEDISGSRSLEDLPENAQQYINALEELAGVRISGVGVGSGRDEVIQVRDLISEG